MNFLPGSVFGTPVYYSELCLKATNQPVRKYQRRRWQSDAQFNRKVKKWNKRYGFKREPCIYMMDTSAIL